MKSKQAGPDQWRTLQANALRDLATRLVLDPATPEDLLHEAKKHLLRPAIDLSKPIDAQHLSPRVLEKIRELRDAIEEGKRGDLVPAETLPESTHEDDDEPDGE